MSSPSKRLHIVTGKGGVGKTVYALSLCKSLKDQGKSVLYNSFDQPTDRDLCRKLGIEVFELSVTESAETYVSKKLGSKMVASWIMKTPFFSSLFQMIPGLGHMILMGHIINKLEDNPDLHIVMDSPSSGHALTMFESSHNFKAMFKKGLIVKDIERMHNFLHAPNGARAIILTLPTLMALQEGIELRNSLQKLELEDIDIIMNDSYMESKTIKDAAKDDLPAFLLKKLNLEQRVREEYQADLNEYLPHFSTINTLDTVREMSSFKGESPNE